MHLKPDFHVSDGIFHRRSQCCLFSYRTDKADDTQNNHRDAQPLPHRQPQGQQRDSRRVGVQIQQWKAEYAVAAEEEVSDLSVGRVFREQPNDGEQANALQVQTDKKLRMTRQHTIIVATILPKRIVRGGRHLRNAPAGSPLPKAVDVSSASQSSPLMKLPIRPSETERAVRPVIHQFEKRCRVCGRTAI